MTPSGPTCHRPACASAGPTRPSPRVALVAIVLAMLSMTGVIGCRNAASRGKAVKFLSLRDVRTQLEVTARARRDQRDSTQATGDESFSETIFQQRLRVEADGYAYHPNLLDFSLALVGGLQQSKFDETRDGTTRNSAQNDTLEEFDLQATLFQNKNFPATVRAVRSRTFDPRPFRSSLETTTTGFDFTWQYIDPKTPTLLQLSRTDVDFNPFLTAGERPGNRRNTVARFETGYHFSKHNILSLRASREELVESPIALRYNTDIVNVEHRFDFGDDKQHRVLSTLRFFDQRGTFDIQRTEWRETLRMQHTDRLRSWFTFEVYDRTQGNLAGNAPVKETSYQVSGDIEHRLYDSLTSRLSARFQQQEFGSGLKIERQTVGAFLDYRKKNRWGELRGNLSIRVEPQQRTGGDQVVAITDEPRTFRDPEPVIINGSNISLATLTLIREDRTETYRRGRDYRIQDFRNHIEIERIPTGRIRDEETVLVSYENILAGNFDLDTIQQRFGVRQAFDFGLTVYYRFYAQEQTISPPSAGGISVEDITSHTLGAEYQNGSFHLFGEYEDHASTISPFEAMRLGGDYSRQIGTATASINALWSDIQFHDVTARKITLWTIDGRYRHPITRRFKVEAGIKYRSEIDTIGGDNEGVGFDLSGEWSFRTSEIRLTYEYTLFSDSFADDESQRLLVRFVRRF